MRNLRRYRTVLGGSMTALLAAWQMVLPMPLSATPLYWDLNGTAVNIGATGTGAWDGVNLFWNTNSTGSGGTIQAGTTIADDLFFSSGTGLTSGTITVSSGRFANSLTFEESGNYTLDNGDITLGGATGLTFSNGTGSNIINTALILAANSAFINSDNSTQTFNGGVTGTGNLTLTINSTGGYTFSTGAINNTGIVTHNGSSTGTVTINSVIGSNVTEVVQNSATSQLTLANGLNTFGTLTIKAGTVQASQGTVGQTTALGSGTVTLGDSVGSASATLIAQGLQANYANPIILGLTSGTLTIRSANTGTLVNFTGGITGTNNITISTGASGTAGMNFSTNAINNTGTITHATTVATGALAISGGIGSNVTGVIQNSATAQLTISGTNTYSGPTSINAGTLALTGGGTLAGTAVTGVSGTTFLVTGNSTMGTAGSSSVTIFGGGVLSLLSGTVNTLNINSTTAGATVLTLGDGSPSVLNMEVGATADQIILGSGLKAILDVGGATVNITSLGGLTGTTQTLISASGGGLNTGGGFTLNAASGNFGGYTLGLNNTGTLLQLTETANATPAAAYWNGVVGSTWSTFTGGNANNSNWLNAAAGTDTNAAPGATTNVFMTADTATNLTTTLGLNFVINSLTFTGTGTAGTAPVSIGGANTLTLNATNANGNTAGAGIMKLAGSGADTISAPVILGGNQSWSNDSSSLLTISGGVTGTANLIFNATNTGGITLSTTGINNTGTLTNAGAGAGTTTISAAIGSNVTSVIQAGISPFTISSAFALNANNKTLTSTGSGLFTFSGGITGTQDLILNANSTGGITLSTANVNNVGTITNSGSGSGISSISSVIGNNVTGIVQNSLTSQLNLSGSNISYAGTFTIKAGKLQASASLNAFGLSTNVITIGDAITNADATLIGNLGGTVANPIVLASGVTATLTITSPNVSTQQVFSGGVTGNNNLVVSATNAQGLRFNTSAVNNTGTVTANGTGAGTITIDNLGTNVTSVTQAGISPFTITSAFALSATNKTLASTGSGLFTLSGGISGAQNLILNANSTGGITLSTAAVNNTGTITNSGTGAGTATISSGVGANVTAITENSNTSALTISTNALTVNAGGTTLTNSNGSGSSLLTVSSGVAGTGNLILNNNSAIANGITLSTSNVNHAGTITNSGTGTGGTLISSVIGSNVTGVSQNSATSQLTLTGANLYAGATSITAGTLLLSGATGAINGSSGISINGSTAKFVQIATPAVSSTVTLTQGTLDGTTTVNTVNVANSASTIITAGNGSPGVLTIGTLTYSGASTINLAAAGAAMSTTLATTTLTTNAAGNVTINLINSGVWSNATYNLVSYGSLAGNGFGSFVLGTVAGLNPRQSASLTNPAGFVTLSITGDNPVWTGLVNGNWTTATIGSPKNWKLFTAGTATDFLTSDNVLFDDSATGTTTINISDANVAPSATTFNNTTKSYTLGSTGGFGISSGALTKSGSGSLTINNTNTYSGATTIQNGTVIVGVTNALPTGTSLILGNNVAGAGATHGTLNLNSFSQTVAGLTVLGDSTTVSAADTILIGAGRTLTVNGDVSIGQTSGATTPKLTASGGGSLVVNGATFQIGTNTNSLTTVGSNATVDFSGLSSVAMTLSGSLNIGDNSSGNAGKLASLFLPTTGSGNTTITAAAVTVGTQGRNGSGQVNVMKLGSGANVFNVANFNVGAVSGTARDAGSVTFTNASGTFKLRDMSGLDVTGRAAMTVSGGAANSNTGIVRNSTFNVTGHNADLLISTLTIGDMTGIGLSTNIFSFDTGILDATTIKIGRRASTVTSTNAHTYTVNFGTNSSSTGVVTVGSGGITLLNQASTVAGAGTVVSTLNILGGTVTIGGDITQIVGAGAAPHTGTLNLNGGTLNMSGNKIGGAAAANNIDVLTFQSGTLMNVAEINNGTVLTKTGAASDTLIMAGNNTYTGGAAINGGILQVNSAAAIGNTGAVSFGGGTLQYTVNNQTDYSARFSTAINQSLKIDTNSQNVTYASALTSSGGTLTKLGAGSLTLSNANSFSGGTTISAGTLVANHTTALGSGNVSISSGAFLRVGSGSSSQELQLNGALTNNGTLQLDIFSNSGGANLNTAGDFITFTGVDRLVTLTGVLAVNNFNSIPSGNFNPGDSFLLVDWSAIPTVSNRNVSGLTFDLSSFSGVAFDVTSFQNTGRIVVTVVPEPGRLLLLMFGCMALCFHRRRRSLIA